MPSANSSDSHNPASVGHEEEERLLTNDALRKKDIEYQDNDHWAYIRKELYEDPSFYFILFLCAFDQGSTSMVALTFQYLYKDDLNLDPATVSLIGGITMIPWVSKPVWGFISDGLPIMGLHRRPYLIISGLVACAVWVIMATVPEATRSVYIVVTLIFIINTSLAFMSTVAKAIMVEHCEKQSQAYATFVQTYYHVIYYATSIVFTWLGGYLLEHSTKKLTFAITAVAPGLVSICAFFAKERMNNRPKGIRHQINLLVEAIIKTNEHIGHKLPLWRPMLFMLIFSANPSSGTAMFYYFTEKLGFKPEFIATLSMVATGFSLVAILSYQAFLSNAAYRGVLFWSTLACISVSILPITLVERWNVSMGIPDKYFVLGDQAIRGAIYEFAQFPLLILGARICPPGVEATMYALLMSILNFGGVIADWLGAGFMALLHITKTDFTNLTTLLIICGAWGVIPLVLLFFLLPASDDETIQNFNKNKPREEEAVEENAVEQKEEKAPASSSDGLHARNTQAAAPAQ